jgi:hypothetical protein
VWARSLASPEAARLNLNLVLLCDVPSGHMLTHLTTKRIAR